MSTYYKCLRGDSQHLALTEADAFFVRDIRGRNWICYPIPARKVENLTLLAHVTDVFEADAAAQRHGLGNAGTDVRIIYCEDPSELADKLGDDNPPQIAENPPDE